MKGVILAAGVGSRLWPLTENKPKCLVKVNNKPLIEYQLDSYRNAGVTQIIIVVGYKSDAIREYCKHINDLEISIVENKDFESTNNMYSLYLLRKTLQDTPFILNNADLAIDKNLVSDMLADQQDDLIAVDTSQYNDESMKVSTNEMGIICDISKSIKESAAYGCSVDFYKFSVESSKKLFAEICRIIEQENNRNQWTEVALQTLLQQNVLSFKPHDIGDTKWAEVDNYDDLQAADFKFSSFDKTFSGVSAVLLDLDGTVFIGNTKIHGSDEFINRMRTNNIKVFFLSNNSSRDKKTYIKKLSRYNIKATEADIVLSTDGLISFLKKRGTRSIFVLGTSALYNSLKTQGFEVNTNNPEYVVVGYDTELTYDKLRQASSFINSGADIIATHIDIVCPTESGPIPDAGAILELLRLTTGKKPVASFGKPDSGIVEHLARTVDLNKSVVIGDRVYTDMQLAHNIGAQSVLVLSGETKRDDVEKLRRYPDIVAPSLASFL